MSQRIFLLIIFFFMLTAALIQTWLFSSGYYSISSDESARTLDAFRWYSERKAASEVWLPMHSVIIGYSLEISRDLILTPRMVSLLFSLLSMAGLILLTDNLFRNRLITLTALLLYTLLPERIILSAVPLAEIIFICLIIYGAAFLIIWINQRKISSIMWAALFWAVSGTLRYEGWIFSASLLVYSIFEFKRSNLKLNAVLPILLLLISFPLYWALLHHFRNGDPVAFFTATSDMFKAKLGSSLPQNLSFNAVSQFVEQNYNSYNIIGLAGLFFLFRKEKLSAWIVTCFSGLFVLGFISVAGKALPSHNFWRTPAVWTILLIPFTSYILFQLSECLLIKKPFRLKLSSIVTAILLVQFLIVTSFKIKNMKASYCLTEKDLRIGDFFNKIIHKESISGGKENPLILVEKHRSFDHLDISLSSNHPENFLYFDKPGSRLPPSYPEIKIRHPFPGKIKELKITHLLLKSEDNKRYLRRQKEVKAVQVFGDWVLYKVGNTHTNTSL